MTDAYVPLRPARTRTLDIRGVSMHVREWGESGARPLGLVHGARDSGASFQFVVDALRDDWHVIAPDWRGHGRSGWTPGSYWQAEFMVDLDVLLDRLFPGTPVTLAGHSMGGNVASLYAGTVPARVQRLILLDSMGDLLNRTPFKVDEILTLVAAARHVVDAGRSYPDPAALAKRLMRRNRRLNLAKAQFLAAEMARTMPDGGVAWLGDPSYKRSYPNMNGTEDWGAVWRHITAPVLQIMSTDPRPFAPNNDPAVAARRRSFFADLTVINLEETGHNIHHDAPEAVAEAIERFAASREAAA